MSNLKAINGTSIGRLANELPISMRKKGSNKKIYTREEVLHIAFMAFQIRGRTKSLQKDWEEFSNNI